MARRKIDPQVFAHLEWLGFVRPTGLVVSAPALVRAGAILPRQDIEGQRLLESCVDRGDQHGEDAPAVLPDFEAFAATVLQWNFSPKGYAGAGETPVPPELEAVEQGEVIRPDYAVRERNPKEGAPPWQLLVLVLPTNTNFDKTYRLGHGLDLSPHGRLERLLRKTGVGAGLLFNGTALRLVSAPRAESSGWLDFRLEDMRQTSGRPICTAMRLLLSQERLLAMAPKQRLAALLEDSRKFQNEVSDHLAEQVLHALYELVRGFQAAHERTRGELLRETLDDNPDEIYRGLLTVLLRLVFLLYAEERDMLPEDETFLRYYTLAGLYERLQEDAALYPDTMDQRYGAWAQLLVLFRMVHDGARTGDTSLPPREGVLFDPDRFPFLEGRPHRSRRKPQERIQPPLVPDGTVYRALEKLAVLDGERISYRALDVEQIGSVYETMMGFRLEKATGRSLAIKAPKKGGAPTTIDLDALLEVAPARRDKWLVDHAGRKLTDKVKKAVKAAESLEDLHAALLAVADSAATPDLVAPGAMILQPSEERRKSGSHYTPRALTEPIVRTTLEPIFQQLGDNPAPEQILDLKVCDPAMGSGAFLVEACRQLGDALLEAWRRHDAMPTIPADEDEILFARRLVAQRCLYGVDRNPMAVDLAKVSLWLATLAKDHPFTFLDHALRCGDSLVGLGAKQIAAFHWQPEKQLAFGERWVRERIERATRERRKILDGGDEMLPALKAYQLKLADEALKSVRDTGDAVVAAFFSEAKNKQREEARSRLSHANDTWQDDQRNLLCLKPLYEAVAKLRAEPFPVTPFHWEIEFPEVFLSAKKGFDAIVGNPPFAGKNTLINGNRPGYLDWLATAHDEAHGNADLVAHFFRRSFHLLRPEAAFGLIATNTIGQGDTRHTGLRWICTHGGTIYQARKRYKWPGLAAVVVSVVHVFKGKHPGPYSLDGRQVPQITAFLFHAGGHESPATLQANKGKSFIGSYVLGMGFTFDDTDTKGIATPLAEMHRLIEENPRNKEVIFPYIGGEEINTSPTHAHHRYVINFGQKTQVEAQRWRGLFEIVESKVKADRQKQGSIVNPERWWMFARPASDLYESIVNAEKVIAISRVGQSLAFTFMNAKMVFSEAVVVFNDSRTKSFAILQSRPHEFWARFFGSTLEDRLRYTPTDCFETFPFPEDYEANDALEAAGQAYYAYRAELMVRNDEGLTKTYNRFHDPEELSPEIQQLRELHDAMDRAVLDAYGWTDLAPTCEFLLDYEEDDGEQEDTGPKRRKKKPWRYRWPDDLRDEVLARLLKLNADRAEQERLAGRGTKGGGKKRVGKQTPPPSIVEALPNGAWSRPNTRPVGDQIAALAAVLKGVDGSMPIRDLRLTALLALKPSLLTPSLTAPQAALWRRLIGPEAEATVPDVPESDTVEDQAWGQAVRQLRGTGLLIENVSAQTWAPGPGLDKIVTTVWPEGRVQFVMEVLRQRKTEEVLVTLPSRLQEWINAKAA